MISADRVPDPPSPFTPWTRAALVVVGALLLLAAPSLSTTVTGTHVTSGRAFTWVGAGELLFALGVCLLSVPGAVLVVAGLGPWAGALQARVLGVVDDVVAERRRRVVGVAAVAVFACVAFRAGQAVLLLDLSIADDENSARFGGQLLAMGRCFAPAPAPHGMFSHRFEFVRDGLHTSMEWLGVQLAWALAEAGASRWVFSALASLFVVATVVHVGRRQGARWAVLALVLCCASPMAMALSMTSHAHVVSRGLLAATFLAWSLATTAPPRAMAWVGLLWGGAFATRPFESAFLFVPFAASAVLDATRASHGARARLAWLVVGAVPPLAAFAAHNHVVTGHAWLPARLVFSAPEAQSAARDIVHNVAAVAGWWPTFGNNVAFNALRLAVWFLGPVGALLAVVGAVLGDRKRDAHLHGLGVLSLLSLGLFHQDFGIGAVGPIHQSEAVVLLVPLVVEGLRQVAARARVVAADAATSVVVGATVAAVVIPSTLLLSCRLGALAEQARLQRSVRDVVDRSIDVRPAVVVAPRFLELWRHDPAAVDVGTWVYDWPPARPDGHDDVVFVSDGSWLDDDASRPLDATIAVARRSFPERALYRVVVEADGWEVVRVP